MTNTNLTDGLKKGDLVRVEKHHYLYNDTTFSTYRVVRRFAGGKVRITPASLTDADGSMLARTVDADGRMPGNRACHYSMVGLEFNVHAR